MGLDTKFQSFFDRDLVFVLLLESFDLLKIIRVVDIGVGATIDVSNFFWCIPIGLHHNQHDR